MFSGETAKTNVIALYIVFGLTGPVLKHEIYRTQDKHVNHYIYDEVSFSYNIPPIT